MRARLLYGLAFCAWLAPAIHAAEDLRVRQLEQDIAQLKRTVLEQQRRIEQLERQATAQGRAGVQSASGASQRPAPPALPWHAPINWDRLQAGMSETQVIDVLGPPNVVQETGAQKVLFYGGTAPNWGAISGIVELRSGRVARIAPPLFKQ